MTLIIISRPAKCKDCAFCKNFYDGKRKKLTCTNSESERHTEVIRLNDLACDHWKL